MKGPEIYSPNEQHIAPKSASISIQNGVHSRRYPSGNQFDFIPAFPITQPPSVPPPPPGTSASVGSANSGYYSSSSLAGNHSNFQQNGRQNSFVGKQSISSRNASFEDEGNKMF